MTEIYNQFGDMSDAQFERIWNNPGTTFVWKSSVNKRGKSGIRQQLYTQCTSPREMRKLYEQNQSDAFKSVSAKEEFKWDFKRGNVSVHVPKNSQSPFFVRTQQVTKPEEQQNLTFNRASEEESTQEENDQDASNLQSSDYSLQSPKKTQDDQRSQKAIPLFPKTPIKQSEDAPPSSQPKKRLKSKHPTSSWDEIFTQPTQLEETEDSSPLFTAPPVSPAKTSPARASQSTPAPRTPIPYHIRQKLQEEENQPQAPVIKAVPLSYNSSWLERSGGGGASSNTDSPSKRPWYTSLQN